MTSDGTGLLGWIEVEAASEGVHKLQQAVDVAEAAEPLAEGHVVASDGEAKLVVDPA